MLKRYIKQIISGCAIAVLVVGGAPVAAATEAELSTAVSAGAEYLSSQQQADGSVAGFGGETEWAAVAVAASGADPAETKADSGESLVDAIEAAVPAPTSPATEFERKIIALAAADKDPSDVSGTNYTQTLADAYDGTQIGDPTLLNDDSFGIIAAAATGDDLLVPVAAGALDYLLSHQQPDGGFSWTTNTCDLFCGTDSNDTAAAIVAMHAAETLEIEHPDLESGRTAATGFLLGTQQPDGGFGYDALSPSDGSSTAWGLIALNTLGSLYATQADAARNWLLINQNDDGGFGYGPKGTTGSDTYTTSHALIALLGTNWLLDPAPVELAAAQPENDEPVAPAPLVVTPVSTPTPLGVSVSTAVASIFGDAREVAGASTPVVQEPSPATPSVPAAITEAADSTSEAAPSAEASGSSWFRYVGYGLIAAAIAGFVGYVVYARRTITE